MKIWALSDLHLSFSSNKPMDVFGDAWAHHAHRMAEAWDSVVAHGDVVLTPGDFSWAMKPEQARADFDWLAQRPGRKVLVKGNHDFWWPKTRKRMAELLPGCTFAIKRNGLVLDGLGLFGCRGGDFKAAPQFGDHRSPEQIEAALLREEKELQASLDDLDRLDPGVQLRICLFHYPPLPPRAQASRFTPLIVAGGAKHCVYGHLHGDKLGAVKVEGEFDGVRYWCASCDQLGFAPVLIDEL